MRYFLLIVFVFVFMFVGTCRPADGTGPVLKNASFESNDPLEGWQLVNYGNLARVALDAESVHQGRHALRLTAEERSDTALGQEIDLQPHGWYRFTGWVKTRGLDPMGSAVSGTYQIQRSGGNGTLAGGPSHRDDTDWSRVTLVFQAPPAGRIRVAPFLVGFGKGRGTAGSVTDVAAGARST